MRSALSLVFGLCACAHSPAADLVYDPVAQDPAALTFALAYSPAARVVPEATMTLGARHPDGRRVEEAFALVPVASPLPAEAQHGYRVADRDLARLAATRAVISEWQSETPRTEGTFSMTSDPCVSSPPPRTISVWIQPGPQEAFEALVRDASLGALSDVCSP